MDQYTLRYLNENKTELKRQKHYQSQAAELLIETDASDFVHNSAQKKYDKATIRIEELENNIKKDGLIDRVGIWLESSVHIHANALKHEKVIQNKKMEEKSRKKNIRDDYYKNLRKFCKASRNQRYQIRRTQRWLDRTEKFFPEWKIKKLQNMPNNKGYIWRGIHYYGYKPAIPGEPVFLFEQKGKHLYIHEITTHFHKIFIKESKKSRRKLIETKHRRTIVTGNKFTIIYEKLIL